MNPDTGRLRRIDANLRSVERSARGPRLVRTARLISADMSAVNLLVGFERFGSICMTFLVAWLVSLPLVQGRKSALEQRLASLSPGVALSLSIAVSGVAVVATTVYLMTLVRSI